MGMLNQRRKTTRRRASGEVAADDLAALSWGELRQVAKLHGVKSVGVKRAEIEAELQRVRG